MKSTILNEITLSIILIILTILFLDPFMVLMPSSLIYMLVGGMAIIFSVFAGLVWRERAEDERDELHNMFAGRTGYVMGAGVLVVGIIWQTIFAHPDPWLMTALIGLVLGKLTGLYYARRWQ
jgi:apolipoprotein N-acyltransferase